MGIFKILIIERADIPPFFMVIIIDLLFF